MFAAIDLKYRTRAAGAHLLISAALAALIATLVFGLWYPGAFRLLAGGRDLFLLVIAVDVVLGPLLTFTVFDVRKPRRELTRDLLVIAALQLAGLAYGLHTVYLARPVAMVFEVDRFRVLSTDQIRSAELPEARSEYRRLSLTGPLLLGTRRPRPGVERNDALFRAVGGVDIGQRPSFWQPYADSIPAVLARARPLARLYEHYPQQAARFAAQLQDLHVDAATAGFVPVVARGDWVAIVDRAGAIKGYLAADGFF